MKRMTVPAFLIAAVLAFSLAGCSSSQPVDEGTLKGVWALESKDALGIEAYLSFEDDSEFEMLIADSWLLGSWSVSNSSATVTFDEGLAGDDEEDGDDGQASSGATVKLSYSNNKLTMGSADGSKLVFVKDNSEDAKAMFEDATSGDLLDIDGLADGDAITLDGDDEGTLDESEFVEEVIAPVSPAVAVADDAQFSISVTGKGTDYTGDPCYVLSVTNKTGKEVYLVPEDDFKVNGKAVEAGLGDEVAAGQTVDLEVFFAQDELGGGLEALTAVDGVIEVYDNDSDELLASYPFHMD